jgi:hypothetical protein
MSKIKVHNGYRIDLPPRARGMGQRRVRTCIADDTGALILVVETIGGRWPKRAAMRLRKDSAVAMILCAVSSLGMEAFEE